MIWQKQVEKHTKSKCTQAGTKNEAIIKICFSLVVEAQLIMNLGFSIKHTELLEFSESKNTFFKYNKHEQVCQT